jgi:hypothetical protein
MLCPKGRVGSTPTTGTDTDLGYDEGPTLRAGRRAFRVG